MLAPLLARDDLESEKATEAIDIALGWLKEFPKNLEAGFVLPPLLARDDLESEKATEAIDIALGWLKEFPKNLEAGFVLAPLLARDDLESEKATEAIDIALGWLKEFPKNPESQFVLPPLLARDDLESEKATEAIDCSLVWLRDHAETHDTEFVLRNILRRPDVSRPQVLDLKRSSVEHLRPRVRDPNDDEASFLLRWCLQSRVNEPALDRDIFELGLAWLEANDKRKDPDYVFNRILRRPDASEDQWTRAANACLRWLRQTTHTTPGRDFAINSLLTRPQAHSYEDLDWVIREALIWLEKNPSHQEAGRLRRSISKAKRFLPRESQLRMQLEDLDPYGRLVESLNEKARDVSASLDGQEFHSACVQVENEARVSSLSAAFAIPPLLVLACRLGNGALTKVRDITAALLSDRRFSESNRNGLARSCWRLLNEGLFPHRDQAIKALNELGLSEPDGNH